MTSRRRVSLAGLIVLGLSVPCAAAPVPGPAPVPFERAAAALRGDNLCERLAEVVAAPAVAGIQGLVHALQNTCGKPGDAPDLVDPLLGACRQLPFPSAPAGLSNSCEALARARVDRLLALRNDGRLGEMLSSARPGPGRDDANGAARLLAEGMRLGDLGRILRALELGDPAAAIVAARLFSGQDAGWATRDLRLGILDRRGLFVLSGLQEVRAGCRLALTALTSAALRRDRWRSARTIDELSTIDLRGQEGLLDVVMQTLREDPATVEAGCVEGPGFPAPWFPGRSRDVSQAGFAQDCRADPGACAVRMLRRDGPRSDAADGPAVPALRPPAADACASIAGTDGAPSLMESLDRCAAALEDYERVSGQLHPERAGCFTAAVARLAAGFPNDLPMMGRVLRMADGLPSGPDSHGLQKGLLLLAELALRGLDEARPPEAPVCNGPDPARGNLSFLEGKAPSIASLDVAPRDVASRLLQARAVVERLRAAGLGDGDPRVVRVILLVEQAITRTFMAVLPGIARSEDAETLRMAIAALPASSFAPGQPDREAWATTCRNLVPKLKVTAQCERCIRGPGPSILCPRRECTAGDDIVGTTLLLAASQVREVPGEKPFYWREFESRVPVWRRALLEDLVNPINGNSCLLEFLGGASLKFAYVKDCRSLPAPEAFSSCACWWTVLTRNWFGGRSSKGGDPRVLWLKDKKALLGRLLRRAEERKCPARVWDEIDSWIATLDTMIKAFPILSDVFGNRLDLYQWIDHGQQRQRRELADAFGNAMRPLGRQTTCNIDKRVAKLEAEVENCR